MNDFTLSIVELASIGCTPEEIIAELDLDQSIEDFIQAYKDILKKGLLKYQVTLKRAQAAQAKDDPQVLKWLAQVYLKQTDKQSNIPFTEPDKYSDMTRDQLIEILHGKKT